MTSRTLLASISLCLMIQLQAQNRTTSEPVKRQVIRKVKTEQLQNINEVYYLNNAPYTGVTYDYFDNNTLQQEINWLNGILEGTKTEYFPGGLVRAKINFKSGKRHGPFIFYHENGEVRLRGNYFEDALDSTINAFYSNGNPKYVHNYDKGVMVGELITYYKNGNIEQKTMLKNEKPHGLMLTYYEAGNLRMQTNHNEGIRDGQFLRYHLTGLIAEEGYYKNGFQDSISRYWDNVFGTLMKEEYYKMGKKEGCWVTYNEAGDTLTVYNYKDDKLNGPYRIYFSGIVEKGDLKNGKKKKYDPSKSNKQYVRALDEYGFYIDGLKDSVFVTGLYRKENHVEGHFSKGVMVGEWKYYNAKGKMVLHEKYNELGELIYQKPKIQPSKSEEEEEE